MISRRRLLQLAGVLPFVSREPSENPCAAEAPKVGELTIGPFGEDRTITRLELTTRGDWLVETVPTQTAYPKKLVHIQRCHQGNEGAA